MQFGLFRYQLFKTETQWQRFEIEKLYLSPIQWNFIYENRICNKMNGLKAEGKSIPIIIINQIQKLLQISKTARKLCHKISKINWKNQKLLVASNQQDHKFISPHKNNVDGFNSPEKSMSSKSSVKINGYFDSVQGLYEQILQAKADFVYYERILAKQLCQKACLELTQEMENICTSMNHEFYRSRKTQVKLITSAATFIDEMERKIKKCLSEIKVQYPEQLSHYIKSTVNKIKKLHYKLPSKIATKYAIKVKQNGENHQPQKDKGQTNEKSEIEQFYAKRQTVTNATTRPSSTGKSASSGIRFNMPIPHFQSPQVHHSRFRHARKSHTRQRSDKLNVVSERPKTAKVGFQLLFYGQNEGKCSKETNNNYKSQREILYQNQNAFEPQQNCVIAEPNNNNPQQEAEIKFNALFAKKQRSGKQRKHRFGIKQNNFTNGINTVKAELSHIHTEVENENEDNLNKKTSVRVYSKKAKSRFYQSHQNLTGLYQIKSPSKKPPRSNKKKLRSSRKRITRNSKLVDVQKIPEEENSFEDDQRSMVLLIKPSQQILKESKSNFYPFQKPTESDLNLSNEKKKKQREIQNHIHAQLKRSEEALQLLNAKKQKMIMEMSHDEFKLNLEQLNKIREQFVRVRKQNNYAMFSQKVEHSAFFIQQQFLSHRENLRYQTYLKKLKQTKSKQNKFEPFSIETQIEQLNNMKLKQTERNETFKGEGEWIKHRFHKSEQKDLFTQLGFDINKKIVA